MKVVRRKTRTGNALLVCPQGRPLKEAFDRSNEPQLERVFLPTHGHYVQKDLHLDGSPILHNGRTPPTGRYGTRGHTDDKVEQLQHKIGKPHRHGEGSFDSEGTHQKVRELQNKALCEKGPQQCFNCQKFGHHASKCRSEIHTCRYCAGRHHSHQCKDNKQLTLKCPNCGQEHATTSRLYPKRIEAEKKTNTAPASQQTTQKQDIRKPSPIPLANAWATLTVQEV